MKNGDGIALVLFDCDLRTEDNPAFYNACAGQKKVLPLFILDEKNKRKLGAASRWFLHYALKSFSEVLKKKYDLNLILKKGDSLEILSEIFSSNKITEIYFNKLVEPDNIKLHEKIKNLAKENSIEVFTFLSQTIFDPETTKTTTKSYFKIFTPFWRACLKNYKLIPATLSAPKNCVKAEIKNLKSDDLKLLPEKNWHKKFEKIWEFDYKKIRKNLEDFLEEKTVNYYETRNIPGVEGTSKISPYLHFGMISPKQVFKMVEITQLKTGNPGLEKFLTQIGWREFCHHLLFHFPALPQKSFYPEFDRIVWEKNAELFERWKKGQTGYPFVDAGMRELAQTGWMHGRARMVVASFLIKDLLLDWRDGEEFFWDYLVDADLANNSASWQWVAGSGADAAPYYRVFNPSLQGKRFDADGEYVRKWVPEIAKLPNRYIQTPWEADEKLLKDCGIKLGKTYPLPVVDHAKARDLALMVFRSIRN